MSRLNSSVVLTIALIVLIGSLSEARAQYRGGIYSGSANPYNSRPTVSPYLNLLQPGGGLNLPQYQTLVKPFLEQQAVNEQNAFDSQMMRRQVNSLQNQVNQTTVGVGRATGHPTRFMNFSHYYNLSR